MKTKQSATVTEPIVGVVLPLFKHSVLVNEAIQSFLDQEFEGEIALCIVNDGCPHRETDEVCRLYSQTHRGRIFYVRKVNGGLSSARNAGVNFLLKRFPSIEAFYFLDADNFIYPHTIRKAWETLRDQPDHVGWVYPDIDMFGTDSNVYTGGKFSRLKLLFQNYCEAGSMTRRAVFETGVRYDENMLLGYEDWEFWFQAMGKGFIGRHVEHFGFNYRKRPESMLANSTRDDQQIRAYMRRKHKKLFSIRNLLNWEQEEAPRYALRSYGPHGTLSATYLDCRERDVGVTTEKNFYDSYAHFVISPYFYHSPPIRIFACHNALTALEKYGLLSWLHWYIDDVLLNFKGIVLIEIRGGSKTNKIKNIEVDKITPDNVQGRKSGFSIVAVSRDFIDPIVKDTSDEWFVNQLRTLPEAMFHSITIRVPEEYSTQCRVLDNFMVDILYKRQMYWQLIDNKNTRNPTWKKLNFKQASKINQIVRELAELPTIYPMRKKKAKIRDIGFVLPLSSFGGVEKVTHNLAKALKKMGYIPHLFIFIDSKYTLFDQFQDVYETVNFLMDDNTGIWTPDKSFYGAYCTTWYDDSSAHSRAVSLLSAMDIVVNQHSAEFHAISGMIKRMGIKTVDYLHLLDKTRFGEDTGYPFIGVAYEHGFDNFVVISEQLKSFLHGMGVPEEKIVVVPNAPSYEIDPDELRRRQREKLARRNEKLRVLYIGRLDSQKGLERLEQIYDLTRNEVEWKIVGKSVLGSGDQCRICEKALPPVFDERKLSRLYEWADCIVMPSHNEGVPLVILEAMRLGAIPICSDVGAIHEVIEDGLNGYLVENDTHAVIRIFTETIRSLNGGIDLRKRLQRNCVESSEEYRWDKSAKIFEENILASKE